VIEPVYRVRCSGPCRRWLSLPENYQPGEDIPHAALEPQPTAARAGMWPDETAARYAAFGAGWSGGTCPDCRASEKAPPCGDVQHRHTGPCDVYAREQGDG
jgi:hypothetical protein